MWLSGDLRRDGDRVGVDGVVAGMADHGRVLRRFLAMTAAHAGWFGPAAPRLVSFLTWCTNTLPGSPHSSHRRVRSRWISSFRGWDAGDGMRSMRTAFLSLIRGIPPNRATRSGLPSR